jgi:hypothetical protein
LHWWSSLNNVKLLRNHSLSNDNIAATLLLARVCLNQTYTIAGMCACGYIYDDYASADTSTCASTDALIDTHTHTKYTNTQHTQSAKHTFSSYRAARAHAMELGRKGMLTGEQTKAHLSHRQNELQIQSKDKISQVRHICITSKTEQIQKK